MSFFKKVTSAAKDAAKDADNFNQNLRKQGFKTGIMTSKDAKYMKDTFNANVNKETFKGIGKGISNDWNKAVSDTRTENAARRDGTAVPGPSADADQDGPSVPINPHKNAHKTLPTSVIPSVYHNWEAHKPEKEKTLSEIMGVPWTIFVDVQGVYSYALHQDNAKENIGGVINAYFDGANKRIAEFIKEYGDEGKDELNKVAHKHLITLEPTTNPAIKYGSATIVDGRLVILFKDDQLSVASDTVMANIGDVI